jgi:hypothetical protein
MIESSPFRISTPQQQAQPQQSQSQQPLHHHHGSIGGNDEIDTMTVVGTNNFTWHKCEAPGLRPAPRFGHSSAVRGSIAYIFGGSENGNRVNSVLAYDASTLRWSLLTCHGTAPTPRSQQYVSLYQLVMRFALIRLFCVMPVAHVSWIGTSSFMVEREREQKKSKKKTLLRMH